MSCKPILIPTSAGVGKSTSGSTLFEAMIAMGITALLVLVLISMSMFSSRAFAAFYNYVDLDDSNKIATDILTGDIRECNRVVACTTTQLSLEDSDGATIDYVYNPADGTLRRQKGDVKRILLTGCDMLTFTIAQRNPVGYTYEELYKAATPATAKVVNIRWNCSRTILGKRANTENVQTARIVIRKQKSEI